MTEQINTAGPTGSPGFIPGAFTSPQRTVADSGGATPVSTSSTTTTTEQSGATPGQNTPPAIDWNTFDWEAHADSIPWDKLDAKRIEKIPNVRKMQSTYERKLKDQQRQAQQEAEVLRQQLNQYQQIVSGQDPDLAQRLQGVDQQGVVYRMQQQLEHYQEMEARKLIASKYELPEEVVFGFQGGPEEVMTQVLEYKNLNQVNTTSTLEQRLAEMQKKLDAFTRQRSDPAANADVGVAQPATSAYQKQWEALVAEGRGTEAGQLYRDALAKGVNINTSGIKPKGWA